MHLLLSTKASEGEGTGGEGRGRGRGRREGRGRGRGRGRGGLLALRQEKPEGEGYEASLWGEPCTNLAALHDSAHVAKTASND
jgi:hypothetical protein